MNIKERTYTYDELHLLMARFMADSSRLILKGIFTEDTEDYLEKLEIFFDTWLEKNIEKLNQLSK